MISLKSASRMGPWQLSVSLLLLAATMINYMDRQTLANLAPRITAQFELSQEQYGRLEQVFGIAFACGSLVWGILADLVPVRWLYPFVLLAWSAIGFITGLSHSYDSLYYCRGLLGFFESGHWPCALVVTHAILTSSDRAMGNSILQSGASLGAVLTPLIITAMVAGNTAPDAWRPPFLIIGSVGIVWSIAWFIVVRPGSIASPSDVHAARMGTANTSATNSRSADSSRNPYVATSSEVEHVDAVQMLRANVKDFFRFVARMAINPKFWALVFMVTSINTTWQLIRAWLPKFLQEGRGYSESQSLLFNSAYYISTDVGCLLAGAAALWLARRGLTAHGSRLWVYGVCAALSSLTIVVAILPASPALLGVLLIIGAGTLGLFPCYYSFTQELDAARVGKVTGLLSFLGWYISSQVHPIFGRYVDLNHSYDLGIACIGIAPALGLVAMLILWPTHPDHVDHAELSEA